MKKYFTYTAAAKDLSEYIIVPSNYDDFPWNTKNGGSYNLAPARLLGLSYVTYLKFIKTMFPNVVTISAEKGSIYPVAHWKAGPELSLWIKTLNAKMELGVRENENRVSE